MKGIGIKSVQIFHICQANRFDKLVCEDFTSKIAFSLMETIFLTRSMKFFREISPQGTISADAEGRAKEIGTYIISKSKQRQQVYVFFWNNATLVLRLLFQCWFLSLSFLYGATLLLRNGVSISFNEDESRYYLIEVFWNQEKLWQFLLELLDDVSRAKANGKKKKKKLASWNLMNAYSSLSNMQH